MWPIVIERRGGTEEVNGGLVRAHKRTSMVHTHALNRADSDLAVVSF